METPWPELPPFIWELWDDGPVGHEEGQVTLGVGSYVGHTFLVRAVDVNIFDPDICDGILDAMDDLIVRCLPPADAEPCF